MHTLENFAHFQTITSSAAHNCSLLLPHHRIDRKSSIFHANSSEERLTNFKQNFTHLK
jgi:hypothetical protein